MVVRNRKSPDYVLMLTVSVLLAIGVVMVYSSSFVKAEDWFDGDGFYYLKRQAFWTILGLGFMIAFANFDYWKWNRLAKPGLIVVMILLLLVFVPGIGRGAKGAYRWIGMGPIPQFQPSEIMKTAFVIYMAKYLTETRELIRNFKQGFLPPILLLGVVFALILAEPDLGTALAIGATTFVMLFVGGARIKHLIVLASMAIPGILVLIIIEPYRMRRLMSFWNPWASPLRDGFQIIQSLYALGSGGLFGVGLGQSRQKFFYLPEQHTDMIFAIIGEELGFIGAVTSLLLFALFAWRGYKVAVNAPDGFSSLVAAGLTSMITLQAALNIGVVTSSLPMTGIPLPFLSYGGSSLIFTLASIGILLNISRYSTR